MILLPAIDLKEGCAVRLKKGDFNEKTVYSDKPWEIAKIFEEAGAGFIHLVDLDGALAGHSVNSEVIKKITSTVSIPTELGGGIRDFESIEKALELGVYRVILGTVAVKDPDFVNRAVEKFGADRIVVGIDAKNGYVATHGWEQVADITSVDMALDMKKRGVKTIIYTDISRDGMLTGPNIEQTKKLSEETGLNIIASGGVSCMDDLIKLNDAEIYGAIIGKAYYEKKVDIKEAADRFVKKNEKITLSFKELKVNKDGLIPVIVQEDKTDEVLMMAWMNEEAFNTTLQTGKMTYYSRSRQAQWIKGETSGHYQYVKSMYIDCDNDTLLVKVDQTGAACHTNNHSCFYREVKIN